MAIACKNMRRNHHVSSQHTCCSTLGLSDFGNASKRGSNGGGGNAGASLDGLLAGGTLGVGNEAGCGRGAGVRATSTGGCTGAGADVASTLGIRGNGAASSKD